MTRYNFIDFDKTLYQQHTKGNQHTPIESMQPKSGINQVIGGFSNPSEDTVNVIATYNTADWYIQQCVNSWAQKGLGSFTNESITGIRAFMPLAPNDYNNPAFIGKLAHIADYLLDKEDPYLVLDNSTITLLKKLKASGSVSQNPFEKPAEPISSDMQEELKAALMDAFQERAKKNPGGNADIHLYDDTEENVKLAVACGMTGHWVVADQKQFNANSLVGFNPQGYLRQKRDELPPMPPPRATKSTSPSGSPTPRSVTPLPVPPRSPTPPPIPPRNPATLPSATRYPEMPTDLPPVPARRTPSPSSLSSTPPVPAPRPKSTFTSMKPQSEAQSRNIGFAVEESSSDLSPPIIRRPPPVPPRKRDPFVNIPPPPSSEPPSEQISMREEPLIKIPPPPSEPPTEQSPNRTGSPERTASPSQNRSRSRSPIRTALNWLKDKVSRTPSPPPSPRKTYTISEPSNFKHERHIGIDGKENQNPNGQQPSGPSTSLNNSQKTGMIPPPPLRRPPPAPPGYPSPPNHPPPLPPKRDPGTPPPLPPARRKP